MSLGGQAEGRSRTPQQAPVRVDRAGGVALAAVHAGRSLKVWYLAFVGGESARVGNRIDAAGEGGYRHLEPARNAGDLGIGALTQEVPQFLVEHEHGTIETPTRRHDSVAHEDYRGLLRAPIDRRIWNSKNPRERSGARGWLVWQPFAIHERSLMWCLGEGALFLSASNGDRFHRQAETPPPVPHHWPGRIRRSCERRQHVERHRVLCEGRARQDGIVEVSRNDQQRTHGWLSIAGETQFLAGAEA